MTETCYGLRPVYDQHGKPIGYAQCDKALPDSETERRGWRNFGGVWYCPDCAK